MYIKNMKISHVKDNGKNMNFMNNKDMNKSPWDILLKILQWFLIFVVISS